MLHYTNEQLATVIALPLVTILLVWTTAIFEKNRKQWGPYDIPIVSLLILSIIRNLTILTYTLFVTLNQNTIDVDYCSVIIWIFNSIHTFQASSLTTLAIIGLFSIKLHNKQQHIRQFLTATHVIYHLFCLTTLCACVGVAAILAQDTSGHFRNLTIFDANPCKFMPFDLDIKFNVFIIVLNGFLATVSMGAFIAILFHHYKINKRRHFDYLKKSNSDLSDLSAVDNNKNYYDTYTIQRGTQPNQTTTEQNFYDQSHNNNIVWNSDVSNISTTVSSTNSRRPCIVTQSAALDDAAVHRTGLETIHPVLIVCYLFYHLPIIVLCIYPTIVAPWPVAGIALWLGLVQDLLIPIGLSIVDSRFCQWVSNVYKCSDKHGGDKLPHVGLDGKFRPFSSQPQSLEVVQNQQHVRPLQSVEHRFPITNGSLYTSIDGRLPVIHNYRRHKDPRIGLNAKPLMEIRRPEFYEVNSYQQPEAYHCRSCEADLCPSHSNLHHLTPQYINKQLTLIQQQPTSIAQSHESLRYIPETHQDPVMKNSRNLVRLNRMRLCKSEDSLHNHNNNTNEQVVDYTSSDDDYHLGGQQNFDTLSSTSSFSITTEANGDFEFFQSQETQPPANFKTTIEIDPSDFKITRSNSKRSLEHFQMFVEEEEMVPPQRIQRSNSYMTLEDRKRRRGDKKLLRSDSKLSDCTHNIRQKIKSVEYLPSSNASTVFIEDVFYFNYPNPRKNGRGEARNYVGSVPDLKKVFISEYI